MRLAGEHLLAFVLIIGFPVWDAVHMGYARRHRTHAVRVALYATIIVVLWLTMGAAVAVSDTAFLRASSSGAPHLSIPAADVTAAVIGMAIAIVLSTVLAYRVERVSAAFAKALEPVAFMLPRGPQERLWFALVSVSAGVCEEVLYRGFLLHYGLAVLHLAVGWAIALAAVAFGVAHTYQGLKGIFLTGLLGVVFLGIYLGTGVLWPAILVHALTDLRVAMLPDKAMPA
jgi:membrane protease YdiL (CAAX protease family)